MKILKAGSSEKAEIIALYRKSQAATRLPNPLIFPPAEIGDLLYARNALERFIAVEKGRIVGHGLIEEPNPDHCAIWRQGLPSTNSSTLIEFGGDFVDPDLSRRGIWTQLLAYRLAVIRRLQATPVSATWEQNEHVKRTFKKYGAIEVGAQHTVGGVVNLFVFQ